MVKPSYVNVLKTIPLIPHSLHFLIPTDPFLQLRISLIHSIGFVLAQHLEVVGYHFNRLDEHVFIACLLFSVNFTFLGGNQALSGVQCPFTHSADFNTHYS